MENKNVEYYLFNINEKLKYKHKALFHSVLEGILVGFLYYIGLIKFPYVGFYVGLLVFIYFIFILILLSRATKDFDYKVEKKNYQNGEIK